MGGFAASLGLCVSGEIRELKCLQCSGTRLLSLRSQLIGKPDHACQYSFAACDSISRTLSIVSAIVSPEIIDTAATWSAVFRLEQTRLITSSRLIPPQASPVRGLLRVLGLGFGVSVTVGNTIGAGIMETPGQIAARLPVPALIIAAWIAGGLYSLLGTFAMAELGAMIPRSGGYYVLTRRAYGEYLSFAVGWTDWLGLCASGAAVAILAGQYAQHLLPGLGRSGAAVAIVAVMELTLVQWLGVRWGGWAQNITSGITAVVFFCLIAAGLILTGRTASTSLLPPVPSGLDSLRPCFWCFSLSFTPTTAGTP